MEKKRPLKPFLVIWVGQALSLLGSRLVQFALIWWLTETTQSATVLAFASLVGLLPAIVLGPFAGVLIDRWNRRRVMLAADTIVALATLGLGYLFWQDIASMWHVFVILFIRGLAGSFHWSAMQASTTLMVPEKHLTRIQGVNQTLYGALNVVAAPAGALLLSLLPMQSIIAIDVLTALFAVTPLLFIPVPQPAPNQADDHAPTTVWSELLDGLRYVRARRGLMLLMALGGGINLVLNPAFALLPILVTDHFRGGALQLGWLQSAFGVGAVGGGVLLSTWGGFQRRIVTYLCGISSVGLFVLLMCLIPASYFHLAIAAMFMAGLGIAFTDGPLIAILQASIAPEMQGRVMMLLISCFKITVPLGLVIAGPSADLFSARLWFAIAGLLTVILSLSGFLMPALLNIEEEQVMLAVPGDSVTVKPLA